MTVGNVRFLRGLYDLRYLFADKWLPAIVFALWDGPLRRVEILSTVNSYSVSEEWSDKHTVLHDSILARTLKKMTEEGLVTRTRRTEIFPPVVIYSLNPEVVEFLTLVEPLIAWTEEHRELIARAQAYRRRDGDDMGTFTGIDGCDELEVADEDDEVSGAEDSRPIRGDIS